MTSAASTAATPSDSKTRRFIATSCDRRFSGAVYHLGDGAARIFAVHFAAEEGVRTLTVLPERAFVLPILFTAGLAALARYEPVRQDPALQWSILGSAAALIGWTAVLYGLARLRGRTFTLEFVPRAQHYVQACAHTSIFLYWGWYWPPVYDYAYLIVAQLLFAYAFDMLLGWSRRETYTLGFGPFPIILSTNLFLWFREDWFYLQFLMVAVGFAGKELIRWSKDGRQTHIFNPSSFSLTVFSVALLATGMTGITRGQDIAITQFYPLHMYLFLFLVALPGQILFGVTTMTMSAVVTTYVFGLVYYGIAGTYYFYDSYIPIAVFLGMHLLFTDPSTAPRTELGRLIFGALYGLSTIVLYDILARAGLPTFYDKLLQVPLMNVSIRRIDRAVRSGWLQRFDPSAIGRSLAPRRRNLVYVSLWAVVFAAISAAQGVGDRHRGQWIPFWQQACAENRPRACAYLAQLHATSCRAGSGWSCSALEILQDSGRPWPAASPSLDELPILLRGSKGPITDRGRESLYSRACAQGWYRQCEGAARRDKIEEP
jgi:hypothetical protein